MSLHRVEERRPDRREWVLATGTLACPRCDAPVLPHGPISPAAPLACPFCARSGPAREFLSLEPPARPALVEVRVRLGRTPRGARR